MRKQILPKLITMLFCSALGIFLLLYLFAPKSEYSEYEKRYFVGKPAASTYSIISGSFMDKAEEYAEDHLPLRNFFLGMNAYLDLYSGRQAAKEIWVGRSGRLYESPVEEDNRKVIQNMNAINAFSTNIGQKVDLMLVPSAGYVLSEDLGNLGEDYLDDVILSEAESLAEGYIRWIDLLSLFKSREDKAELYYRTDHHWTSKGANLASQQYLESKYRRAPASDYYTVQSVSDFFGTTYSRSCLWLTSAENIELWNSKTVFTVENSESDYVSDSLFYLERLEEPDKYPVFLDGNHSMVRIHNHSDSANGKLLVIKDSFANSLGCFLAEGYEDVVMVDLRYYKKPVSELVDNENFNDVLILYSIGNFLEDDNIVRLS